MIFDATVSRNGKVQKIRGNQLHLDNLIKDGYQIIDSLPVVTHRPTLPRDRDSEKVD